MCRDLFRCGQSLAAIYVPLNFRVKENELPYMLNTAEANTIFAGERYIPMVDSIRPQVKSLKNFISIEKKHEGMLYYEDMICIFAG